jgi:hypothetical protein
MNGTKGDNYTFTQSNFNPPGSDGVSPGPDGVSESVVNLVDPTSGYWSTLDFTGSNGTASTSTLVNEIENGVAPGQLSSAPTSYYSNPVPSAEIAEIMTALTNIIGYPVAVPIYDTISPGNGANPQYDIVWYATVRIVAVDNINNNVTVQPAVGDDPTAIPNTILNGLNPWTQGGQDGQASQIVLHLSR